MDDTKLISKPFLSTKMAVDVLWKVYGMKAKNVKELPSYCDQNFHMLVGGESGDSRGEDRQFILKAINSSDSLHQAGCYGEIVSVLEVLRGSNGVLYPTPVKNIHGEYLNLRKFHYGEIIALGCVT